jgi:hypothetical protein
MPPDAALADAEGVVAPPPVAQAVTARTVTARRPSLETERMGVTVKLAGG